MSDRYEQVTVRSRQEWRAWLGANHTTSPGVWVITFKKDAPDPTVPYDELVLEALAHGWVDSRPRKIDAQRSGLLITPRRPSSNWSGANKRRVQRLVTEGLMTPAGTAAVEAAQASGTWEALDAVEALEEPADLRAALDTISRAREHWDAFPPSTRRSILEWILSAKRAATRERRVTETAEKAAQDIRANQWRQPGGRPD